MQPEGHLHGTVQLDGDGQFGSRLLPHDCLRIEGAETQVAMGLKRAHAKCPGQGEGLAIMALGRLDLRGRAVGRDVDEEPRADTGWKWSTVSFPPTSASETPQYPQQQA